MRRPAVDELAVYVDRVSIRLGGFGGLGGIDVVFVECRAQEARFRRVGFREIEERFGVLILGLFRQRAEFLGDFVEGVEAFGVIAAFEGDRGAIQLNSEEVERRFLVAAFGDARIRLLRARIFVVRRVEIAAIVEEYPVV